MAPQNPQPNRCTHHTTTQIPKEKHPLRQRHATFELEMCWREQQWMLLCLNANPSPPPTSARITADIAAIAPVDKLSPLSPSSSSTSTTTAGGFVAPSEVGASLPLEGSGVGVSASDAKIQKIAGEATESRHV